MNEIELNTALGERLSKKDYEKLKNKLMDLARAYYDDDAPKVSDHEYDMLMVQLKACEKKNPSWVTDDSISQVIGGTASSKFSKVTHDVPMLSIEDVFNKESVKEWMENVKTNYPDAGFTVEEKIDGLSCTLRYKTNDTEPYDEANCVCYDLVLAETRGNGIIGEDVTENVLQIPDVPKRLFLSHDLYGDSFQVRGEIYMKHENFEKFNEKEVKAGRKPAANPRNLAAGTLRQKEAVLVKERGLNMFIFRVQKVEGATRDILTRTQYEAMQILKKDGFKTAICGFARTFEEVEALIDEYETHKDGRFGYDIDGAVVKIDVIEHQDDFSTSSKYIPGHIAYKYPQKEQKARVTDIDVALGRTGKLTFTAVVCDDETGEPLQMCGTSVSRVTLHNMDYIRERHIGIGGVYGIFKSGEIIPKLTETIYKEPERLFEVPTVCPFCGSPIVNLGSTDYFCSNDNCKERAIQQLDYFVGRDQMNIEGLSIESIRFLDSKGYINASAPASLYFQAEKWHEDGVFAKLGKPEIHLENEDGWSEKSVENLVTAIDKSRTSDFIRVLASFGLPNVGHGQAKLLKKAIEKFDGKEANYFGRLLEMYKAGYDFSKIEGFGDVIKKTLNDFCQSILDLGIPDKDHTAQKYVDLLDAVDILFIEEKAAGASSLEGLTFVVTGSFENYKPRKLLEDEIESLGGKVSGTVSAKTSYLINNDTTSSSGKNKKAKELGVKIISEQEYRAMAYLGNISLGNSIEK